MGIQEALAHSYTFHSTSSVHLLSLSCLLVPCPHFCSSSTIGQSWYLFTIDILTISLWYFTAKKTLPFNHLEQRWDLNRCLLLMQSTLSVIRNILSERKAFCFSCNHESVIKDWVKLWICYISYKLFLIYIHSQLWHSADREFVISPTELCSYCIKKLLPFSSTDSLKSVQNCVNGKYPKLGQDL